MKAKFMLIAAAAAISFVSAAKADSVTATITSPLAGQQDVGVNSPVLHGTDSAGGFNWVNATGTGPNGSKIPSSFRSYCIELTQGITLGGTFTFQLANLENAPKPTQSASSLALDGKADNMRRLFDVVISGLAAGVAAQDVNTMTGDYAAAFQLAVWDIVYDKSTNARSIYDGDFFATGSASTLAIADKWLKALSLGNVIDGVYALTSDRPDNFQDQVIYQPGLGSLVPLPSAALGGLMLMGGLAGRRRMSHSA
jgi:hypothetical protein